MTNLEGRVIRRRRAFLPPPGLCSDIDLLIDLARRLGKGQFFSFPDPESVFNELRRASAGGVADYSGITYQKIEESDGVFWPCPAEDHPGTPRLFTDGFSTPNGKARFHPVQHQPPAEEPDENYPFYLTTGRVLAHYQSGAQTRRVSRLQEMMPHPLVEMHPTTARQYALEDGDVVTLVSRRGSASFKTRLTPGIRPDTLFAPFHWGGAQSANRLTNPALDPISRMPEFKVCAVRIERFKEDTRVCEKSTVRGEPLRQAQDRLVEPLSGEIVLRQTQDERPEVPTCFTPSERVIK
jgi:assimilatory nitrate reductase catalytic subunit